MPTYRVTSPDGQVFNVTAPEGASQADIIARAQSSAPAPPKTPEPTKAATPPKGDIPILGQAVRDVNTRESFGWATPLMTAIVPETYPELAAMLGLTLIGGPLAGAAGKASVKYGLSPAMKYGGQALSRVASAALPAAGAGALSGDAVTPATGAAIGQGALEAIIPALRAVPGVSHMLSRSQGKGDAGKLVQEIETLVPAWAPLLKGKKDARALFDTLVGAEGDEALWAAYRGSRDKVFSAAKAIDSPALVAYMDMLGSKPGAARFQQAAQAMRSAGRGGSPTMSPPIAKDLFDELEKDAIMAAKRISSDPRAGDLLDLVNTARAEIARSVPGAGEEMLKAWEQRGLGSQMIEFFDKAKAIKPGILGPRYDAPAAQIGAATREGQQQLSGLGKVADIITRGRPGAAETWGGARGSTGIPLGRLNIPIPISARSPGYTPGSFGLAAESLVQPGAQRITQDLAEAE